MNEQQIRDEFRKLVIMGNHPECETYEEALDDEVGFGCRVKIPCWYDRSATIASSSVSAYGCIALNLDGKSTQPNNSWVLERLTVLGLPITLGRVLQALKDKGREYYYANIGEVARIWQLTKDGKECDADSQSIETIKDLLQLLK